MTVILSRSQRRRFDRLQPAIDRVTEADARFFERFPARSYRVRLASSAESQQNAIIRGRPVETPAAGLRLYTFVRQIAPGVRLRIEGLGPEGVETDLTDAQAREAYEEVVRPGSHVAAIEAQMRAALANLGARH